MPTRMLPTCLKELEMNGRSADSLPINTSFVIDYAPAIVWPPFCRALHNHHEHRCTA